MIVPKLKYFYEVEVTNLEPTKCRSFIFPISQTKILGLSSVIIKPKWFQDNGQRTVL